MENEVEPLTSRELTDLSGELIVEQLPRHGNGKIIESELIAIFNTVLTRLRAATPPSPLTAEQAKDYVAAAKELLYGYGFSSAPGFTVTDNLAIAIASFIESAVVAELMAVATVPSLSDTSGFEAGLEEAAKICSRYDHRHSSGYPCESGDVLAKLIREQKSRVDSGFSYPDVLATFDTNFRSHSWWSKRIDGTPLANDLSVLATTVFYDLLRNGTISTAPSIPSSSSLARRIAEKVDIYTDEANAETRESYLNGIVAIIESELAATETETGWQDIQRRVYAWLGVWRDKLTLEAVTQLQDTLGPLPSPPESKQP